MIAFAFLHSPHCRRPFVNDLLDFSKLQRGEFEVQSERIFLAPLVQEVFQRMVAKSLGDRYPSMREAIVDLGGDPAKVNPLAPAELVIDHSVIADVFGTKDSFEKNTDIEYERNRERYRFLRWGQTAFDEFKVVPPGTGIVHQVNIEYLARVIMTRVVNGTLRAYPDTVVGTDSHTTMVNGLGVLGWGVGGIEAEAAMLGQPISMLIPEVIGVKFTGKLREGVTATDLVLTVPDMPEQKIAVVVP